MGNFVANVVSGITGRIKKQFKNKHEKAGLNWWKIKYLKHVPYNKPGTYNLKGHTIHYNNGPEILHSLKEIFSEDIYNIPFKTKTPYILDCGANIGLSVIYLKRQHPGARIVAFEPDLQNFKTLTKNIESQNWQDIELRNEAIWKENGTLSFKNDGTLGSKLEASNNGNESGYTTVKTARLKDLLISKVDFVKLDIEGAEYEVLKDCEDYLSNIEYLFIEFHGYFNKMYELTEILDMVQRNGFSFYIKEATSVYETPFNRTSDKKMYDLQLNIFCFKRDFSH